MPQDRIVLRGGTLADGSRADVAITGAVVSAVGAVPAEPGDQILDAGGRLILPGFVDTHSHADGLLSVEAVQHSLLRQGVTTIIAGQDGVSYAPGNGVYATEYFAALDGPHPTYRGGGVAAYLDGVAGRSALNAAYLVPAGTVRWEICDRDHGPADGRQLAQMIELVAQGMADGAVGLSTGLDYVPGIFSAAAEIAALSGPVARSGGIYVSHMRGGYEENSAAGIAEIQLIADLTSRETGSPLPVHISHFHAPPAILLDQLSALAECGIDATFDAYPYTRACTLLAMPVLPPEVSVRPVDDVLQVLADPARRLRLRSECVPRLEQSASLGPDWPQLITLAHIAARDYGWAHGHTIAQAAARAGSDPIEFTFDLLAAAKLQVNAVMAVRHPRSVAELARVFAHPNQMGGSDGIFIGAHPHPRARGTFARFLREYVRETGTWTWADAAWHLAAHPVQRFQLARRGVIAADAVADLIVVDPATVADTATYAEPLRDAVGIDDVLVAGVPVLSGGELTGALPGRGLRRDPGTPRASSGGSVPTAGADLRRPVATRSGRN